MAVLSLSFLCLVLALGSSVSTAPAPGSKMNSNSQPLLCQLSKSFSSEFPLQCQITQELNESTVIPLDSTVQTPKSNVAASEGVDNGGNSVNQSNGHVEEMAATTTSIGYDMGAQIDGVVLDDAIAVALGIAKEPNSQLHDGSNEASSLRDIRKTEEQDVKNDTSEGTEGSTQVVGQEDIAWDDPGNDSHSQVKTLRTGYHYSDISYDGDYDDDYSSLYDYFLGLFHPKNHDTGETQQQHSIQIGIVGTGNISVTHVHGGPSMPSQQHGSNGSGSPSIQVVTVQNSFPTTGYPFPPVLYPVYPSSPSYPPQSYPPLFFLPGYPGPNLQETQPLQPINQQPNFTPV